MDITSSLSANRLPHNNLSKASKAQRSSEKHPIEDSSTIKTKPPAPPQRSGPRYKEKFQALRERFDQVSALHEGYERDLELANTRIRKIQAENDLLLDAISITVPATPSLMHLIRPSPTGTSASMPMTSYQPVNNHHSNGHGHGHSSANGRYHDREREYDRVEPNDPSAHEPSVNGRPT
ncbi:hypothetical protein BDN67DRAFT_968574 [Paxillus ammoniavirescens]|nr:hypothetical protein BDN67DRAFT_968574 [Paxillus ammoniavirescens]